MKAIPTLVAVAFLVASGAASADTCSDRVAAMRAKLDAKRHDFFRSNVPQASRWRDLDNRPSVELAVDKTGKVTVFGAAANAASVARAVSDERRHDDAKLGVAVDIVADAKAPANKVLDAARLVPKGVTARLVVRRDKIEDLFATAVAPPGAAAWLPQWLDEARAKRNKPAELGPHLQDGLKRAGGTQCTELPKAYKKIADSNPADVRHVAKTAIPDALEACKCAGVDPAYDVIHALSSTAAPAFGWVAIPKATKVKTVAQLVAASP